MVIRIANRARFAHFCAFRPAVLGGRFPRATTARERGSERVPSPPPPPATACARGVKGWGRGGAAKGLGARCRQSGPRLASVLREAGASGAAWGRTGGRVVGVVGVGAGGRPRVTLSRSRARNRAMSAPASEIDTDGSSGSESSYADTVGSFEIEPDGGVRSGGATPRNEPQPRRALPPLPLQQLPRERAQTARLPQAHARVSRAEANAAATHDEDASFALSDSSENFETDSDVASAPPSTRSSGYPARRSPGAPPRTRSSSPSPREMGAGGLSGARERASSIYSSDSDFESGGAEGAAQEGTAALCRLLRTPAPQRQAYASRAPPTSPHARNTLAQVLKRRSCRDPRAPSRVVRAPPTLVARLQCVAASAKQAAEARKMDAELRKYAQEVSVEPRARPFLLAQATTCPRMPNAAWQHVHTR